MSAEKTTGTVKWYDPEKGYGFIASDAHERDVFLHRVALEKGKIDTIETGETVQFVVQTKEDGKLTAHKVKKLEQPAKE